MFVALKDLRHARGRFALITVTVALMATLVSFLSGLTGGLTHQTVSGLDAMKAHAVVLDGADDPSLDRSHISPDKTQALLDANPQAVAVTALRTQVSSDDVYVFAMNSADPNATALGTLPLVDEGHAAVSQRFAKETGVKAGDTITIEGQSLTVDSVIGDVWYNHTPVIVTHRDGTAPATLVADAEGTPTTVPGTQVVEGKALNDTLASYKAENASLSLINIMLLIITAMVTGAFFVVWTIQRTGDIATLKALGATTGAIMVDALGQAALIVAVGILAGVGITLAAAAAIGSGLPFVVNTSTTVVPALALFVLGLLGAAVSLVAVGRMSPLQALNSSR